MLTCFGPASRNRSVGVRIGKGESLQDILVTMNEVAEGVPTIKAAHTLAGKIHVLDKLPLLQAVFDVMHRGVPIPAILERLMELPVEEED